MFGIIASIFRLFGKTYYDIILESEKQKSKCDASQKGYDTYFDNRGAEWFIMPNGKDIKCMRGTDFKTHHYVLQALPGQSVPAWTILKDYTEIELKKEDEEFHMKYDQAKEKAIQDGKKFFRVNVVGDYRAGRYELETGRHFKIGESMDQHYYIYYMESTKKERKTVDLKRITEEEAIELGGWW